MKYVIKIVTASWEPLQSVSPTCIKTNLLSLIELLFCIYTDPQLYWQIKELPT